MCSDISLPITSLLTRLSGKKKKKLPIIGKYTTTGNEDEDVVITNS